MTKPATLFDVIQRQSYGHKTTFLSRLLHVAHRFVLDADMSAFLTDLAVSGFLDQPSSAIYRRAEWIRESARLPFPVTWIEFDERARHLRRRDYHAKFPGKFSFQDDKKPVAPEELAELGGWLLVNLDDTSGSRAIIHDYMRARDGGFACVPVLGSKAQASLLPITYRWTSGEAPLMMHNKNGERVNISPKNVDWMSRLALGIPGYSSDHISISYEAGASADTAYAICKEWSGELRHVWAFLATLNELPVTLEPCKGKGGFVGRHAYRKYLDHTVIHLRLPAKRTTQTLANTLIKLARRRAHQVRGHWRQDFRHPGQRVWVRDHQRGDPALGFVKHDYAVEKEITGRAQP